MTNRDSKIIKLLDEGFSYETVKKMSNYHIDRIYKSLVNEMVVRVPAEKLKDVENDLNDLPDDATVEVTEDDVDNIKPFKGQQTQNPKQVGPSTDDGDGNYQDGMDEMGKMRDKEVLEMLFGKNKKKTGKMKTPITTLGMFEGESEYGDMSVDDLIKKMGSEPVSEAFKSKSQQGLFFAKCEEEGPKSKWCKMAREFSDDTKNWKSLPDKVKKKKSEKKEEMVRQLEESIVSLIRQHKNTFFTKKNLMNMIIEDTETAPAPVRTPTKVPTTPKRRPTPNVKPKNPKAEDNDKKIPDWFSLDSIMSVGNTETAPSPVRTPTKVPTTPKRRPTPNVKPKNPKARKK